MGGFHVVQIACGSVRGEKSLYRTYFHTGDAVHFHVAVNLAMSRDCLKRLSS